jgi:hypothetical protein
MYIIVMNIIMPQEYTANIMHQKPDVENNNYVLNNNYELLKNKLNVHDKRIVKLEDKLEDKIGCMSGISKCVTFLENVCLWTLVILLSIKVFS